jgi:holo-[acyl-carrier protein] synthase
MGAEPNGTARTTTRVGIDVASVRAVADSITRFGEHYTDRLFTAHEIECCEGPITKMAEGLAARFAAKEAAIKVLRPAAVQLDWRSIQVRRDSTGWCELELSGAAQTLAHEAGITEMALSFTHEGDVAAAVVVATGIRSEGKWQNSDG